MGDRARPSGLAGLWFGVLCFRWASLAWMVVLTLGLGRLEDPAVAWGALIVTTAWTLYLTFDRRWDRPVILGLDLVVSTGLILLSGLVAPEGTVTSGNAFFATSYPISTVLTWGIATGPWGGLGCGALLSIAVALSRPVNGVPLSTLSFQQVLSVGNGAVYYLAAGGTIGLIARLLRRSSQQLHEANEAAITAGAESARLAEREVLARRLHDSALQSLAMITKRGRELAATPPVDPTAVSALADVAEREERQLRSLISREDATTPTGMSSLRDALEDEAAQIEGCSPAITATGPILLPLGTVAEVTAAVRQALENVVRHAEAQHVTIFLDEEDGWASVTVRDDGQGFEYDPDSLAGAGRMGVQRSMKGRIEDLGGTMRLVTRPGSGTEVEFRVPVGEDETR